MNPLLTIAHRLRGGILLLFLIIATLQIHVASTTQYQVGTGIGDITGPVSEITFMGYAEWDQVGQGLLQRVHARAYIVLDLQSHNRICFVNTDTQSMGDIVKARVIERLEAMYGDLYTIQNVMLSSTHTHSSMGGYLQYSKNLFFFAPI